MVGPEKCVLREAFIKNDLFEDGPSAIWRRLERVFCVGHSSKTTFWRSGKGAYGGA